MVIERKFTLSRMLTFFGFCRTAFNSYISAVINERGAIQWRIDSLVVVRDSVNCISQLHPINQSLSLSIVFIYSLLLLLLLLLENYFLSGGSFWKKGLSATVRIYRLLSICRNPPIVTVGKPTLCLRMISLWKTPLF